MKKTKVFLIDDDTDDQEIFEIAMQKHDGDVECVFADDGLQALKKLKSENDFIPDYIFIDINMPLMGGEECLEEIRKIEKLKKVPVYMYSTSAEQFNESEKRKLGVTDYIVKPSSINDLTAVLSSIIKKKTFSILLTLLVLSFIPSKAFSQDTLPPIKELKKLPIEELMNIMVTSVSRTPQNLTEVASAIQVITNQDIRRSTALRLPEALRLAPNLQVAQSGTYDWGISARGFNGAPVSGSSLANKLLVMIDGRSVYTPLFGGVYWDVSQVLLEDIERVEVVSGPGGVLWGANAVNGVINVLTKNTRETQGLYATGAAGSFLKNYGALRYGSKMGEGVYYKVYAMRYDYNSSQFINGTDARDNWNLTQGGFRMDLQVSEKNDITFQGDLYAGNENDTNITSFNGLNVLGKWTHTISETSDLSLRVYVDQAYKNIRLSRFRQNLFTYDFDFDHRFSLDRRNKILWGAAYRLIEDDTEGPGNIFSPQDRTLKIISGFVQDEIAIIHRKLDLTLGLKVLYDDYSEINWHPTARIAYFPSEKSTIWAAVSKAVRTPSRFDTDITAFNLVDHPEFKAEKVTAYEAGFRIQPQQTISFSFSGFFNQYKDLRSLDSSGVVFPAFVFGNNLEADSWGFEFSARYVVLTWWRLRGGYTYLQKDFTYTSEKVFENTESVEAIDPDHQLLIHSIMDLPKGFQLDVVARYIDRLPEYFTTIPETPSYYNFNVRLAWEYRYLSLSVAGQNLVAKHHREFGNKNIPRSIYGKLTLNF